MKNGVCSTATTYRNCYAKICAIFYPFVTPIHCISNRWITVGRLLSAIFIICDIYYRNLMHDSIFTYSYISKIELMIQLRKKKSLDFFKSFLHNNASIVHPYKTREVVSFIWDLYGKISGFFRTILEGRKKVNIFSACPPNERYYF